MAEDAAIDKTPPSSGGKRDQLRLRLESGCKFKLELTGQGRPPSQRRPRPEPNLGENPTELLGRVGDLDQTHRSHRSQLRTSTANTRRSSHAQGCRELRLTSTSAPGATAEAFAARLDSLGAEALAPAPGMIWPATLEPLRARIRLAGARGASLEQLGTDAALALLEAELQGLVVETAPGRWVCTA